MGAGKILEMWKSRMQRESLYSTAAYWDSKAVEYEGHAVSMWPNNHLNRYYHGEQLDLLQRMLPSVEGLRLLDLGCGTGRNARYFAQRGARVTGIDFSGKAIEIARRLSSGSNPEFRQQSLFDLDDREAFDIALSWGVLTVACKNETEVQNILQRVRKLLTKGGKVLLCEPIHRGPLHRVLNMDIREFLRIMESTGFEITSLRHLHFWPARILLAYVQWPKAVTATGFYSGRAIMSLLNHRHLGDYKVICAKPA